MKSLLIEQPAFPSYNYLFKQEVIDNRIYLLFCVRIVQRLHRQSSGALYEENLFLCPYGCIPKRKKARDAMVLV